MKILKLLLVTLVVVVILAAIIGTFLPSSVHVERSILIRAPQATVYVLVNGFQNFNRWSPWFELDPDANFTYEGPQEGVGARMSWRSEQRNVGTGSQEIVVSEPYDLVRTHLDFETQGTAEAYFELEPTDEGTNITWGFDTDFGWDLIGRYFGLMFDSMLGNEYENGLANLKEIAEAMPSADWSDLNLQMVTVEPRPMAFADGVSSWDPAEIAQALGTAYSGVRAFMDQHDLEQAGPPIGVTRLATESEWHFEAGIPLSADPEMEPEEGAEVFIRDTYGGTVIRVIHVGPYSGLQETKDKIDAYIAVHDLKPNGYLWEEWVSDPGDTPEDRLITNICVPIEAP